MKKVFEKGDLKVHSFEVIEADIAAFNGDVVHSVCSTFALAREIEWSTRLFVLEMKDAEEEGIGTKLEIEHKGPAFVGERIEIEARVESLERNELICRYIARVGGRVVAEGITGQKVLPKQKITDLFKRLGSV